MVFVEYFIAAFVTERIPAVQRALCCFPEFVNIRQVIKVLLRVLVEHAFTMSLLEVAVSSRWHAACRYLPMIIVNELLQPLILQGCLG